MKQRDLRWVASTLAVSYLAVSQLGCAATEPFPPAPAEVLLIVNKYDPSLTIAPTNDLSGGIGVNLPGPDPVPPGIAARDGIALVPLGDGDAVAVVDLVAGTLDTSFALANGSGAMGAAIIDDSIGYVANPGLNTVTRLNYRTGDTASVAAGITPQALMYTRGKLFVLNGNLDGGGHPIGASWITVIDPVTNAPASGIDSIPLLGPGNARAATVAPDGLLYVLSAGDSGVNEGRLSIVNPVTRVELGSFGGFGTAPAWLAAAGTTLYVASWTQGLMSFDTRTREIIHGAGDGVLFPWNSSVAAGRDRIFLIGAGICNSGIGGVRIQARRMDNFSISFDQGITGDCGMGAIITTVPAAP